MTRYYGDLIVWQKAMELVTKIYHVTREFPKDELFGLVNQIRRAAVSIPSNIAEGQGRLSAKEFRQFLGNARGSLAELETQIKIACNLQYLAESDVQILLESASEVGRLLNGLITSCNKKK